VKNAGIALFMAFGAWSVTLAIILLAAMILR